jgi:hypothetical protein
MCLVLFAWATRQDFFENLTNLDVRLEMYKDQIEQIESELLPILYNDGLTDEMDDIESKNQEDIWLVIEPNKIPKKVIFEEKDNISGWFI